jgi:ribosomal RNA-processing protein 17
VEAHVAAITAALREANDLPNEEAQEFEEWQGIEEEVDHEDEYVDEDKFTTVTVEAVGISRDGFTRPGDASESESEAEVDAPKGRGGREQAPKAKPPRKRSAAKSKRRNFRYESKEERSATRFKEKRKLLRRKIARQERKK